MKRIDKYKTHEKFQGDNGETLGISYSNSTSGGYHEGVEIHFHEQAFKDEVSVFIEDQEAKRFRDLLLKLYPVTDKQMTA